MATEDTELQPQESAAAKAEAQLRLDMEMDNLLEWLLEAEAAMAKELQREALAAEDREVLSRTRTALSEIAAQISVLQAKLGVTESADIAEAIGKLESIAAQLASGMISVASLPAILARVQEAIGDAHEVAEAAGSEWKGEVTVAYQDAVYAEYQEKRLELARELMAQTEFYTEYNAMMMQTPFADIFAAQSDSMKSQMAIDRFTSLTHDKDQLVAKGVMDSLIPAQQKQVLDASQNATSELTKQINAETDPVKKAAALKQLALLSGLPEFNQKAFIERYLKGEIGQDEFDAETQRVAQEQAYYISNHPMFAGRDWEQIAREKGYDSFYAYILAEQPFSPDNIKKNIENNPYGDDYIRVGSDLAAKQFLSQQLSYALELGFGVSKYEELSAMDQKALVERLVEDGRLQEYIAFMNLSPEEQVDRMIKDNKLDSSLREQALQVARSQTFMLELHQEKNPFASNADLAGISLQMNLTMAQLISGKRSGETPEQYNDRMKLAMRDFESNAVLNPYGIRVLEDPAAYEKLKAALTQAKTAAELDEALRAVAESQKEMVFASEEERVAAASERLQKQQQLLSANLEGEALTIASAKFYRNALLLEGVDAQRVNALVGQQFPDAQYEEDDLKVNLIDLSNYIDYNAELDTYTITEGAFSSGANLIESEVSSEMADAVAVLRNPDGVDPSIVLSAQRRMTHYYQTNLETEIMGGVPSSLLSFDQEDALYEVLAGYSNKVTEFVAAGKTVKEAERMARESVSTLLAEAKEMAAQVGEISIQSSIQKIPEEQRLAAKSFATNPDAADVNTRALAFSYYRQAAEAKLKFSGLKNGDLDAEAARLAVELQKEDIQQARIAEEDAAMAIPVSFGNGSSKTPANDTITPEEKKKREAEAAQLEEVAKLMRMGLSREIAEKTVGVGQALSGSGVTTAEPVNVVGADAAQAAPQAAQGETIVGGGDNVEDPAAEKTAPAPVIAADPDKQAGLAAGAQ